MITAVDGESITINANIDAIHGSNLSSKYPMSYNIVIEFKDGKIKFAPVVLEFSENWSQYRPLDRFYVSNLNSPNKNVILCVWYTSKNGRSMILNPELKQSFDQWANSYIAGIVSKVNDNW